MKARMVALIFILPMAASAYFDVTTSIRIERVADLSRVTFRCVDGGKEARGDIQLNEYDPAQADVEGETGFSGSASALVTGENKTLLLSQSRKNDVYLVLNGNIQAANRAYRATKSFVRGRQALFDQQAQVITITDSHFTVKINGSAQGIFKAASASGRKIELTAAQIPIEILGRTPGAKKGLIDTPLMTMSANCRISLSFRP